MAFSIVAEDCILVPVCLNHQDVLIIRTSF